MWNFLTSIANATSSVASFVANFFIDFATSIVNVFQWLWDNLLSPAFTAIGNAFDILGSAIGGFFSGLWTNLSEFFKGIPEFFINFWETLKKFFISIFVPEEGYFENTTNDLKSNMLAHIDVTEYQRAFNNLQEIKEGDTAGLDVNFKDYKIGDTGKYLSTPKKWVAFDFVLKHKSTWFSWVRAVTWIFFIIYNINQFLKVIWGRTASDGSNMVGTLKAEQDNPWAIKGQQSLFKD